MTRGTMLELDSYRLAQYAAQLPCYVCAGGNTFDAELCRHCQAPMALRHQANTQGVEARMLAAVGASGVGKTVYLGMLMDMLSRKTSSMQLLARGAFSISLQQAAVSALSRCEFPRKTPAEPDRWNWVHGQVSYPGMRKSLELVMPDLAGEALLTEIDHPNTYPVVRSVLTKAAGLLVLVDGAQLHEGERDQDFTALKLLTYLHELAPDRRKGWPARPLALVFSKADQCEACFADPDAYAQRVIKGAWQFVHERFRRARFFAAGTVGGTAYRTLPDQGRVRIPLRVEPRGIVEPFAWLVRELK